MMCVHGLKTVILHKCFPGPPESSHYGNVFFCPYIVEGLRDSVDGCGLALSKNPIIKTVFSQT